jgi:heme/copper-type cytochrome/quinol oxidase subunit 2
MIHHYLKVAFRNMWKYKSQTLISVAGLAVGFACFAMATLWIRYEMTYDSFHKNADRIYCVSTSNIFSPTGMSRGASPLLAGYLKATFPEIANAITILPVPLKFELEGVNHSADMLKIDSAYFGMFDVRLVEGSMDFLIPGSKKFAITREKALQLFGNEDPLGKEIKYYGNNHTICAVVTGLPKRSNYPFDLLTTIGIAKGWNYSSGENTLVELVPGVDIDAFKQKLYKHEIEKNHVTTSKITLTPLTTVRYEDVNINREVKFQHIIIFAVAGSLLILCTLFNYLTLFISRFRLRQKELALRTVYGASGRSLFTMLSVEFFISLIAALALGLMIIDIACPYFRSASEVKLELSAIYLESIVYIVAIIVIALAVFLLTLAIFRRRTLNANIRSNKKMFRKMSIAVQLTVSIVFAFCTVIILKQMYYLHNTDLGFAFKNRGSICVPEMWGNFEQIKVLNDKIKQIPEIKETLFGYSPLLPITGMSSYSIYDWDDKPEGAENLRLDEVIVSEQYGKYYELELIEGDFLNDNDDENTVLLNESATKIFGWNKATGKSFNKKTVKGVIKNIYNLSPTIAARPSSYINQSSSSNNRYPYILFKYPEGTWKICRDKINKILATEIPNNIFIIENTEDEYDKFLKSENTLLAILTVVSLVCVIVCVFGFVSMVALTCEERRREIAIRKINGATIKDILDIFFKEHLTLLVIGAIIAFPVGYIVMKRWLEQYVVQTEMSAWIYLSILLALFMAIVLCIGGRVYKTSRENPIKAINN